MQTCADYLRGVSQNIKQCFKNYKKNACKLLRCKVSFWNRRRMYANVCWLFARWASAFNGFQYLMAAATANGKTGISNIINNCNFKHYEAWFVFWNRKYKKSCNCIWRMSVNIFKLVKNPTDFQLLERRIGASLYIGFQYSYENTSNPPPHADLLELNQLE